MRNGATLFGSIAIVGCSTTSSPSGAIALPARS